MGVHQATQTCWLKHLTCQLQPLTDMATVAPMALEALKGSSLEVSKGVSLGGSMGFSREPSMGRGVSLGVSKRQVGAGNHVGSSKQHLSVANQQSCWLAFEALLYGHWQALRFWMFLPSRCITLCHRPTIVLF